MGARRALRLDRGGDQAHGAGRAFERERIARGQEPFVVGHQPPGGRGEDRGRPVQTGPVLTRKRRWRGRRGEPGRFRSAAAVRAVAGERTISWLLSGVSGGVLRGEPVTGMVQIVPAGRLRARTAPQPDSKRDRQHGEGRPETPSRSSAGSGHRVQDRGEEGERIGRGARVVEYTAGEPRASTRLGNSSSGRCIQSSDGGSSSEPRRSSSACSI